MTYTLLPNGTVQRDEDKAVIPRTMDNRDYVEYTEWLAAGNNPKVQLVLATNDTTFGEKPWLS